MFDKLYNWTLRQAKSNRALWALGCVSLAESAFLPIPIEALTIPLMMANLRRVWLVALVATAGSVAGGALGYAIGYYLYEGLGSWLLEIYGYQGQFESFRSQFHEFGWWIVLTGGITPIPYKVVSIASGVAQISFPVFILASALSRGVRFAAFALLFWFFGPRVQDFLDRYKALVGVGVTVVLVAGFVAVFWFN